MAVIGYLLPITTQYIPNTKRAYLFDNIQEGIICIVNNKGGDQGAGIPQERICAIKMTARLLHYLNKEQRVKWKVLLKSHKIKWKDEQLLAVILIFLIDLFRRCT